MSCILKAFHCFPLPHFFQLRILHSCFRFNTIFFGLTIIECYDEDEDDVEALLDFFDFFFLLFLLFFLLLFLLRFLCFPSLSESEDSADDFLLAFFFLLDLSSSVSESSESEDRRLLLAFLDFFFLIFLAFFSLSFSSFCRSEVRGVTVSRSESELDVELTSSTTSFSGSSWTKFLHWKVR